MKCSWLCTVLACCLSVTVSEATVTLTSSVDGRRACPDEAVTYNCTAIGVGILGWTAEPFLEADGSESNIITYTDTDARVGQTVNCVDRSMQDCAGFQAILVSIDNPGVNVADLNSTLTVTATAVLSGTVVQCRGTTTTEILTATRTISITSLPSPALFQTPSYTVQEYDRDTVTIRVLWQPPQDDGGAPVVNYTITVSPGPVPRTTTATSAEFTVPYNMMHTASIVVNNCFGSSSAVIETIPAIVGCGVPSRPENGSVQPLDPCQSTGEGSQISFSCNTSYVPAGNMMSICGSDEMWNPDPATFVCIFDCGPPPAPPSGSLESYISTTEGSVVFYSCDPGFVPGSRMMSVCTVNGWSPNPGASTCSVVNCETPTAPFNGFIVNASGILVGAETFFMCARGFVPAGTMRANCTSDGMTVNGIWSPDPDYLMCNASIIDCGTPNTASSGLMVQPYTSTAVNSVIFYQCLQSGFAPSSSSSVCDEDEMWSPDPSQVVCRMIPATIPATPIPTPVPVNCGVPTTAGNGSFETYQDTTEGAEVFFKCNPGFVPAGRMRAVCATHGRWNPDPAVLRCTASTIVCSAPSFAGGIAIDPFNNSKVSSEVFYQCQPGLSLERRMTSVCGEDGRWDPDPSQVTCTTISAGAAIAITAIVCTLITFIAGALCGAVATVCISRWNKKEHSSKPASNMQQLQQTVPVYEEVDTQSQKIELKENVAYRPVKVH